MAASVAQELHITEDVRIQIRDLRKNETNFDSPVDINLSRTIEVILPPLQWYHYEVTPKKVKLNNTGHTVMLTAKWFEERPYLIGGPFLDKYIFSQLHFHWGSNDMEGAEHSVDGTRHPLEMHVVHYKRAYESQEYALKKKDGVAILVYFFKLESKSCVNLQLLLDYFYEVQQPGTSLKIEEFPLNLFMSRFYTDYIMYWGNIETEARKHDVLWLFCRQPYPISQDQTEAFRTLIDIEENPMIQNFREMQHVEKKLYYANPSASQFSTLFPVTYVIEK